MQNSRFFHTLKLGPGQPVSALQFIVFILLVVGFSIHLAGQVSVSISASVVTLGTMATPSFTATVTGSTNTGVTWQVNGVSGGSSTNGLVSTTVLGTANEALYLAPSGVPSPAAVSVTAISQADPNKSATATVTIQLPSRSGTTYYVSTLGNDNNAGTLTAPWRTIQKAANTVKAGDTVQVRGGTYNEIVTLKNSGKATSRCRNRYGTSSMVLIVASFGRPRLFRQVSGRPCYIET